MLGTALYFPNIDIDDPIWLRSAILFWDEIQTIVPSAITNPYHHQDTRICHEEGYLKPLRCDLHQNLLSELGGKVAGLLHNDHYMRTFGQLGPGSPAEHSLAASEHLAWEIEETFAEAGMYPNKMSAELLKLALHSGLARVHTGKLSPTIRSLFRNLELARMHPGKLDSVLREVFSEQQMSSDDAGDWLLVDSRFAHAYMSALAASLSKQLDLSPLTSSEPAHGLSFRFLFDDFVDTSTHSAEGALVSVVMRSLRVDPSVSIHRLIEFKRKREDQYLHLKSKLSQLSSNLTVEDGPSNADEYRDLIERTSNTYTNEIEPQLRALKRELDNQFIHTVWEGAYRALTISVPSAGALAYFTGLSGPELLGAGMALAVTDIGVRSYLRGQRTRATNPYSYLYDISANFGLPRFSEA